MNTGQPEARNWVDRSLPANRVRILHLEDSAADAALILDMLEDQDLPCAITHALTRSDFETAIEREHFDIILCDNHLPAYSGFAALEFAKKYQPQVPVIILSGTLDDEQAVESLKHGATDYILKGSLPRLVPAIRRALDEADQRIIKAAAEERIREQANLLDLTQDAILVRNMNDRIVYWNAGAKNLFGWTDEQALGQDFLGLLQGDLASLAEAKERLMQTGDWMGEIKLKAKSGEEKTVLSRWNLLRDKEGQPRSILSTNTDITDLKRLEAALRQARRMENIGALAGDIMNDLNNTLSPALSRVGLLEPGPDSARRRQHADIIRTCVQRASGMAQRILNASQGKEAPAEG
jgi:PAS domain S-box-containing protein